MMSFVILFRLLITLTACLPVYCQDYVVNPCDLNPCQHGGTCTAAADGGINCQCQTGFLGTWCETPATVDPCSTNPCQNGGLCSVANNVAVCQCQNNYQGSLCGDFNPCSSNPCENAGTCNVVNGAASCQCATGYIGSICADVDPCYPNPCDNGATCSVTNDILVCACPPGFTGQYCSDDDTDNLAIGLRYLEYTPAACRKASQTCRNGGTCLVAADPPFYICQCVDGFSGPHCQKASPPRCNGKPCQNGGLCVENDDVKLPAFSCICAGGFTGHNCETKPTKSAGK